MREHSESNIRLNSLIKYKHLIFISIIIISLSFLIFSHINIESVWPDEALYASHIEKLSSNPLFLLSNEFTQFISYVPIIVGAIINIFFQNPLLSGKIMVWVFAIIAAISTYFIGKELKNEIVGFIAALFFILTPLVAFLSTRLLLDIPVTAMITLTIYTFIRYEKENNRKNVIIFSIVLFLTIFTKNSALLLIPVLCIYWLITRNKNIFKDLIKNRNTQIIAIFGFLIATLLGLRQIFAENLQSLIGFKPIFSGTVFYYITAMPNYLYFYIIPFFMLGLIFLIINVKKKNKASFLILLTIFTYLFVLSVIVPEKVPRYILPILPLIIFTAAYSFSVIKTKNKVLTYAIYGIAFLLIVPMIADTTAIIDSKADSYLGFQEAGAWLKQFVSGDAEVYAGSVRSIRAFSGLDYVEYGGIIQLVPVDKESFFKYANETDKKIFVVLDVWEYTQPAWVYPLSQEVINSFTENGFVINHIVNSLMNGADTSTVVILSKNVV